MAVIANINTIPWASLASVGAVAKASVASVFAGGGGVTPPTATKSWVLHTGQAKNSATVAFFDAPNNCIWQYSITGNTLYKINAADDTVLASVVMPSNPGGITDMTPNYLYYSQGYDYRHRINKATMAVSTGLYAQFYTANQVEIGNYVWTGGNGGGSIRRLDYGANASVTLSTTGTGMAVYDGTYIWFGTNYRTNRNIYKVNPATNTVVATLTVSYSLSVGFFYNGHVYFFGGWSSSANGSWPYNGCCKINVATHAIEYIPAPTTPYDTIGRCSDTGFGVLADGNGNCYYRMLASSGGKTCVVKFSALDNSWTPFSHEVSSSPGTSGEVLFTMYPPDQYITRGSVDASTTRPLGYYKYE